MGHWVCSRNVETLELDSSCLICLPTCVFECQSLAVLKLSDGIDYKLPDSGIISLPNLKKLRISLEDCHKQLMGTLFKSCPLLEDLHLNVRVKESDHYVVYVSSANLKYLTIFAYENDRAEGVGIKFMIDALSLRKFVLLGSVDTCVSFVKRPSDMEKTQFFIREADTSDDVNGFFSRMLKLFRVVSGVRSLTLSGAAICKCIGSIDAGVMPTFRNLKSFDMPLHGAPSWEDLVIFSQFAPNMEVLSMWDECPTSAMRDSCWVLPDCVPAFFWIKLKRIRFSGLNGHLYELKMLRHVLSHANALEHLLLVGSPNNDKRKEIQLWKSLKFCREVFMLPRASATCEIQLENVYITASSNGFRDGERGFFDCRLEALDYLLQ